MSTILSERKTIVFVEAAAAMGGVQFSTLYLAQALDRDRWKSVVVCPEEGDLSRACRDADIEVQVLPQTRLWSTSVRVGATRLPNPAAWAGDAWLIRRAATQLKKFLVQSSPDVVVTKGLSSHFLGGFAARKLRIPCVWHVQDLISERTLGIYRRAFSCASRLLPTRIIVDGKAIAMQLPQALQARISVIHNGVDTDVFRPGLDGTRLRRELGIPEDHLVIGHVGRVTPWKGQHYLIEAFGSLANENPKLTLLLVGSPVFDNDSYQQRLVSLVSQLGLRERVKFTGYRHDLPALLSAMDLFAFTSVEKDTSPLALLSAMASGLPVVAFDIDGTRELMAAKDQFLLVPVADVAELGMALTRVLNDENLRRRLAAAARKQALVNFSLDKYKTRIEQVLREVLSDNVGARPVADIQRTAADLHL
jgi:glycosyltransferase involved in cell wall biosynthesis